MNMLRAIAPISATLLALALAGCSDSTKKELGLEADPPNAFLVSTEAPLSLPPELGQLPQPNPGAQPLQTDNAAQDAENLIAPGSASAAASAATPGEQTLLQQAGPTPPPDIRAQVNQNALLASKSPGFVSGLMNSDEALIDQQTAPVGHERLVQDLDPQPVSAPSPTPPANTQPHGVLHRILSIF